MSSLSTSFMFHTSTSTNMSISLIVKWQELKDFIILFSKQVNEMTTTIDGIGNFMSHQNR